MMAKVQTPSDFEQFIVISDFTMLEVIPLIEFAVLSK
jgi:hypothetical protein